MVTTSTPTGSAVELTVGRTYRIDMKGAILVAPGTLLDRELTLRLPQINAIYDEDGMEFSLSTRGGRDESELPPPVPCDVSRP